MDFITIVNGYFIDLYRQIHHSDIILASLSLLLQSCFVSHEFNHIFTSISSFVIVVIAQFQRAIFVIKIYQDCEKILRRALAMVQNPIHTISCTQRKFYQRLLRNVVNAVSWATIFKSKQINKTSCDIWKNREKNNNKARIKLFLFPLTPSNKPILNSVSVSLVSIILHRTTFLSQVTGFVLCFRVKCSWTRWEREKLLNRRNHIPSSFRIPLFNPMKQTATHSNVNGNSVRKDIVLSKKAYC